MKLEDEEDEQAWDKRSSDSSTSPRRKRGQNILKLDNDDFCGYSAEEFRKLPDHVRKALEVAQGKASQTDFY